VDRLRATCALCVAAAGLLLAAGCRDHAKPKPSERIIAGRVRVTTGAGPSSAALRRCLVRFGDLRLSRGTRIVERHGLLGGSVTIADPRSPLLYGCDLAAGTARVCGGSVGVWRRGRLNDPRLDIICRDRNGRTLGAAWVVPVPRARTIAVHEAGGLELYPVAGGLPVRIWTRGGVDVGRSSAVFEVGQLGADGRELVRTRLRAMVAG
jgi:hypothetical protein